MGQWCSASGFDREGCCCLSEIWLSSEIVSADWTTLAECSPKATHISALLLGFNSWRNEKRKRSLLNCLYLIPHSNSWICVCVCVHACVSLLFSSERARYRSAQNEWLNSICACWQMGYKTTFPLHFSPLPVPLLSFWVLTVNNVPFDPNLFSDLNQ